MIKFVINKKLTIFTGRIDPKQKFYWPKLVGLLILINIFSAFVFSQIILDAKILIPSLYIIPQIFSYGVAKIAENNQSNVFFIKWDILAFYIGGFVINIPLLIFSYYKNGKSYTKRSFLNIIIFTIMGFVFSLTIVNKWLETIKIGFQSGEELNERVKKIQYYLLVVFSAVISGWAWSFTWKNQMSGGGLDFVYTYFARKTKISVQKIALPINFLFVMIGIGSAAAIEGGGNIKMITVVALLMSSLSWGYIVLTVMNYFYPKFVFVQVWIITTKGEEVLQKMRKYHTHGGFVIDTYGLYDSKKRKLISTSITYVELRDTIKLIKETDESAFFIVNPIKKFYGHFQWNQ